MPWILGAVGAVTCLVIGVVIGRWLMRSAETHSRLPEAQVVATKPVSIPELLSEVLDVLRSATVVVGPHDEVMRSSVQARTFGLVRGSRVGIPELLQAARDTRRDGRVRTVDLEIRRGVSTPAAHLKARVARIHNDLVLVLAEDRTQARRVDETRRDFVANVSHELKTPIGAMGLLAEAVEQAADDPEAVRHFASKMQREQQRLAELVGQIIDLSRLQSDDPMLRATVVEIDAIITEATHRCAALAADRKVSLTVAGHSGCRVFGDAGQLADALTNLVHNAIVYSDDGARVAVSAREVTEDGEQFVDLAVSDNGIGIAQADLQRIFERFYRVDYGRSRDNGGTGLGLSIVKHIASVHGGSVSVWSQLGQGSTFTVRLPALGPDSPAQIAEENH